MTFDTWTFAVFFAVVWGVYRLPLSWRAKKIHLLVASYVFYAAWSPPFVLLLVISTVIDFWVARRIAVAPDGRRRRVLLYVSLATNLGFLAFFKYGDFLLRSTQGLLSSIGIAYVPPAWDIVLPVGISFYTFQTLSYTLDVYLRRAPAWPSALDFSLYVSFFPQLVAGPIVRATEFLPQLSEPKRPTSQQIGWGLSLLVVGLFQKCVLADSWFGPQADRLYASVDVPTAIDAWIGTLAFAGQIFCDFAGYSACAIGVALAFGFHLPENFRRPYAAIGFSDFWRRWHITLSAWLRDYLYIPLGGNRVGRARTYRNLMVVMLLGGLWHGAAWTFVVWGGLHGLYLAAERVLSARFGKARLWSSRAGRTFLWFLTFVAVLVTWVFFRATSFEQAFGITAAMFGGEGGFGSIASFDARVAVVLMGALLLVQAATRNRTLAEIVRVLPWWLWSLALTAMIVALVLHPGADRAFIYFQF